MHSKFFFRKLLPVLSVFAITPVLCHASALPPLKLVWNENPEKSIVEYQVRVGVSPGKYTTKISAGKNTQLQIPNLRSGKRYFFVVTARDKNGLWSKPSKEISHLLKQSRLIAQSAASTPATSVSAIPASTASPKVKTRMIGGSKYLVLTVSKAETPDSQTLCVEVSPDLINWFSGENHTTTLTDNARTLKVRDNTPLQAGNKRYIRLKPLTP
ncbi:MAG: fibronectin type III domain-containing protein [Akkermansiaceae bacterium]